jgi:hypothetical protein
MLYTDFCKEFYQSVNKGDVNSAQRALMQELGRILVKQKQDFVDLLNESGYEAEIVDTDSDLVDIFSENVASSPSLMLGASMLVAAHNKQSSYDGEDEYLDDDLVKDGYRVMQSSFSAETYENAAGAIVGGALAATAAGANLARTQAEKKRDRESAGRRAFEQREATKQQLIQGIVQAKQQQAEDAKLKQQQTKTRRTIFIVGGAVLALTVLGLVIYSVKKGKK